MAVSKKLVFPVLCFILILPGCLSMKEVHTRYEVGAKLSTYVSINVKGIHSDASGEEDQKKEMKEFFDGEYRETARDMAAQLGIAGDPKVTFSNKTETSSDATLTGEVHHLLQALVPFLGEGDFEITKREQKLSVKVALGGESADPDDVKSTLSIKYAGKILSNNAHSFDKEKSLMTWDTTKLSDSGIQFVLGTDK